MRNESSEVEPQIAVDGFTNGGAGEVKNICMDIPLSY
jgi:hypothetical protein